MVHATKVVHETPGLLDLKSLSVMGMSAKPNSSSPIGKFGTGLKYAVAILVRNKIPLSIHIGEEEYIFGSDTTEFRGQEHQQLHYRRRRGITGRIMRASLPFTTEYGKNWHIWQALRELHANTLDEGGETRLLDDTLPYALNQTMTCGLPGRTRIVVGGEAYAQEFRELATIFLPEYKREAQATLRETQCVDRPSRHAYWRGMRVGDLQHPALYTWCVASDQVLTEDRTLMYSWVFAQAVAQYVMQFAPRDLVRRVLEAGDETFEGHLPFNDQTYVTCSEDFLSLAHLAKKRTEFVVLREEKKKFRDAQPITWEREIQLAMSGKATDAELGSLVRRHKLALNQLLQSAIDDRTETLMGSQAHTTPDDMPS